MLKNRLAQRRVRFIIQGGGGIVQNQDFRISRQGAGNQQPLPLPARQVRTLDVGPVIQPFLQ